ncbi:MAG TPA: penicillin acylase family protein, partial [Candidatus Obscuribacterales bacterium]
MLRIFSIILVFILLAAPIGGWWLAQRSLPVTDGVITLDALSRSAVVKFDDRGIPHVEASSEKDLWMVQGYATAINRMFQMDILRRTALGELSEVFGDACLADDKLMRTIGFNRMAKEELAKLSQDVRVYLDAYSLGVNEYLQKNVKNLPLEFALLGYRPRPWMPADTVAILKYLQYEQDESWRLDDLRQRIVDRAGQDIATTVFEEALKPTAVSAQPGATLNIASILDRSLINRRIDPRFGSSAFAIAPQISDTRGAMLACDKHGELTEPDRYYLISLSCPTLHLCGATIPGVPGIIAGRNDHISWGSANTKADVQDLYLEQFSTQFPNKYRTADGWQNVTEVIEEIKVRFRKNYLHKVLVTRHGPLLVKNETTGVALNWTGFRNTSALLDASWKLNKAHDWASFTSALESYSGNPQYFVYADRKGMVGLKVAGAVPDRRKFGSGSLLLSGWTVRQEPP